MLLRILCGLGSCLKHSANTPGRTQGKECCQSSCMGQCSYIKNAASHTVRAQVVAQECWAHAGVLAVTFRQLHGPIHLDSTPWAALQAI